MKLDSEEQRKALLDIVRGVPVHRTTEQGTPVPFTAGDLEDGLKNPDNIASLLKALREGEIEDEEDGTVG